MLIAIVAVGAAIAAIVGSIIVGRRQPEPSLIPIPVKRPRRSNNG